MNASADALAWANCAEVFGVEQIMKIGDICPECGEAAVVNEEGCPSKVRPSAMLVGLVNVRKQEVV